MRKGSAQNRHWLTMVFATLAAVVVPALIYQVFVYGRQYDYQLARASRAVAEIEEELSVRLRQFEPLLERTPHAEARDALSELASLLQKSPSMDDPCVRPKNGASGTELFQTAQAGSPDSCSGAWKRDYATYLESCQALPADRNATSFKASWQRVQRDWPIAKAAGEVCAREVRVRSSIKEWTSPQYMEALRQSPGFDRLSIDYRRTGGCARDTARETGFRNVLVDGSEPSVRVVDCARASPEETSGGTSVAAAPGQDVSQLRKGIVTTGYAELPFADLVNAAAADQSFDGLWLFDENGRVYFRGGTGTAAAISAVDARALLSTISHSAAAGDAEKMKGNSGGAGLGSAVLPAFHSGVRIAGASHEVFLQRLSIRFVDLDSKPQTLYLGAGLSSGSFRASVLHLRLTILAGITVGLLLALCMLPYLRVIFIGPVEEIRSSDLLGLVMGVMAAGGIVAIATLSSLAYRTERIRLQDATIAVADSMRDEFAVELRAAVLLLQAASEELSAENAPVSADLTVPLDCGNRYGVTGYELLMTLDEEGRFLRRSECRISPSSPKPIPQRTYFRRIADGKWWQMDIAATTVNPARHVRFFVERIRTLDHGIKNTVISLALERLARPTTSSTRPAAEAGESKPIVAAMLRHFETFWQRLLPPDVGFAVVEDDTGKVLYHSQDSRSLVEKFYEETGHDTRLMTAIAARRGDKAALAYRDTHVVSVQRPLEGVPWTLVVFADKTLSGTAAFGAGLNALALFTAYGVILGLALLLTRAIVGERPWAWAWPRKRRRALYWQASVLLAALGAIVVTAGRGLPGPQWFLLVLTAPVLTLTALFERLDARAEDYKVRHNLNAAFLAVASVAFLTIVWKAESDVFRVALVWIIALQVWVWRLLPARYRGGRTRTATARCFSYSSCVAALALVLAVPVAILIFDDAWARASAQLALTRASIVTHNARTLDRLFDREYSRIEGVTTNPVPLDRSRGWRNAAGTWNVAADGSWRHSGVSKREDEESGEPSVAPLAKFRFLPAAEAGQCANDKSQGDDFRSWSNRSLQSRLSRYVRAIPITFSSSSARLNAATCSSTTPRDGSKRINPERFGWCLGADTGGDFYSAVSAATSFGDWWAADRTGVELAVALFLALVVVLIWMVEPLIHRIFILDLAEPLRVESAVPEKEELDEQGKPLPWKNKRLILIDPTTQEIRKLEERAQTGMRHCIVSGHELLGPNGATRLANLEIIEALIVRELEVVLADAKARLLVLEALERLVFNPEKSVYLVSDVFPFEWLAATLEAAEEKRLEQQSAAGKKSLEAADKSAPTLPENGTPLAEALRWSSVLATFSTLLFRNSDQSAEQDKAISDRRIRRFVSEACAWAEELQLVRQQLAELKNLDDLSQAEVENELAYRAEPFYRKQWKLCSISERLVLLQLAEGALPNPRNLGALQSLLRKGMIRQTPELRIVSESFAGFVRQAEPAWRVAEWRDDAEGGWWGVIRVPLMLTITAAILFVAYVSREAVDATVGLLAAVVPLIPIIGRLMSSLVIARPTGGETKG